MANNIAVSITADVADLQVKRAIMSAELKAATKDLNTFAKEASSAGSTEGLREGMLAAASAAEKAKASIASVNVQLAKSAAEARNAGHAAEEGGHGFTKMSHEIHEAAESVRTFQMRAKEFAEVYVAMFAVEKVIEFAKQMGEVAEKTKHTAEQFGMTVAEVQKLQGVATQTGIPIEALTKGFGIMDKNMVTAKGTTSAMANAFKSMGVSIDDGRTQMEKFEKISDKFKDMENGPKKAALAMLLFGKSGKELIPILNLGAEGIAEMNKRTEEYGGVSEDANAKGVALAESVNESKLAFAGVGNVLTSALAPVLKQVADGLNTLIRAFIDSYKEGGIVAIVFQTIKTIIVEVGAVINALAGIFKALWSAVSEVVSDIVTSIMDAFGVKTPGYFKTSEIALNLFKDTFNVLKDTVILVILVIKGALMGLIDTLVLVGKIAYDAFHRDWAGIGADWKAGLDTIKNHALKTASEIKTAFTDLAATIANAMQGKGPEEKSGGIPEIKMGTGDGPDLGSTKKAKKAPKGKDDLVQKLEEELTARKNAWEKEQIAQNQAHAFSLAEEAAFWEKSLSKAGLSAKDQMAIQGKLNAVMKQQMAARWDDEQSQYQISITRAEKDAEVKLALVTKHTAEVKRYWGEESKEYKKALDDQEKALKASEDQKDKIEQNHIASVRKMADEQIALDQKTAQHRVAMGKETEQQLIVEEKSFLDRKWVLLQDELQKEILAQKGDPVRAKLLHEQLLQEEKKYQNAKTLLVQKAELDRTKLERQAITATSNLWGQNLSKMITLQQSFATTVGNLYKGMVGVVSSALSSIIEKWLVQHLTALILGTGQSKAAASGEIATNAAVAGSGAYAATAVIPFTGPEMAPAAAAAAYGGAMAFQGALAIPGFDVGAWNLSQDQVAMVHGGEMIIPAAEAGGWRNLMTQAANTNSPMAGNDSGAIHLHFNGPTSKREIEKWIGNHSNGVAEGVRRAARANVRM